MGTNAAAAMARVSALALGTFAGACATAAEAPALLAPAPKIDTVRSGIGGAHTVDVLYFGAAARTEVSPAGAERLPPAVRAACPRRASVPGVSTPAGGLGVLLAAAGEVLVNYAFAALDARDAALRAAAVRSYDANLVVDALTLEAGDCIALTRRAADTPTGGYDSALVFQVVTHAPPARAAVDPQPLEAAQLQPIFAHVPRAAAQTTVDATGAARISLTTALSLTAIQPSAAPRRNELALLTSQTFAFRDLELGKAYCAGALSAAEPALCAAPLTTAAGPLFPRLPLAHRPTVGAVALSAIETGALADLPPAAAADLASRKSLASAVGDVLKGLGE